MCAQAEKLNYLKKLRRPNTDHLTRARIFRAINDKCKRVKICNVCKAPNATVKCVQLTQHTTFVDMCSHLFVCVNWPP